jgi:hypothetical protein
MEARVQDQDHEDHRMLPSDRAMHLDWAFQGLDYPDIARLLRHYDPELFAYLKSKGQEDALTSGEKDW